MKKDRVTLGAKKPENLVGVERSRIHNALYRVTSQDKGGTKNPVMRRGRGLD